MAGHVVIAPDKFKGSLTAAEALRDICGPQTRRPNIDHGTQCPVADGGEGTLGTVLAAGFERIPVYAKGPTGQVAQIAYARSVPTFAVAGVSALAPAEARAAGFACVYALSAIVYALSAI